MAGSFITKAIGLAALGLAGYDTVATTQELAPSYARKLRVEQLNDMYMRTDSCSTPSILESKFQKGIRRWSLDNNLFAIRQKITSKVVWFTRKVMDNAVTLGLGAIALFTGKGKLSVLKIPYLDKIAAMALALKGGYAVMHNVFGLGADDFKRNIY